jgi:hypothetical protein
VETPSISNREIRRSAVRLGTTLVLVRMVPLVLHSTAHIKLGILAPTVWMNAYIFLVLMAAPFVAAGMLRTAAARSGAWVLLWSMVGSLVFEVYNHFMAMGPDHVSQVPDTFWGHTFQITAVATAILEVIGCAIAVYLLRGPLSRHASRESAERSPS